MQLKSSYKSNSTRHLYEFAEEIGIFGNATEKKSSSKAGENADGSGRRRL